MRKVHYADGRAPDKNGGETAGKITAKSLNVRSKGAPGRIAISFISNEVISFAEMPRRACSQWNALPISIRNCALKTTAEFRLRETIGDFIRPNKAGGVASVRGAGGGEG